MSTKLFNAVKASVVADLKESNRDCNNLDQLIYDFLSEVVVSSSAVNTAEEWDSLELHDMQQGEL
jgi:hypothetical protein